MLPEIITVLVGKRRECTRDVQEVLTDFGCAILTRVGFHEAVDVCSDAGVIILQVKGGKNVIDDMLSKLNAIEKVKAGRLELSFDG